jgi:hypothetical protein
LAPGLVVNTLLNDSSLVHLPNGGQVLYLMKSLQGDITINNGNTNGNNKLPVKIIQMDIVCTNGVIHVIDSGNFSYTFALPFLYFYTNFKTHLINSYITSFIID